MAVLEEEDIIKWEFSDANDSDKLLREEMQGRTKTAAVQPILPQLATTLTLLSSEAFWMPSTATSLWRSMVAKGVEALN